MITNGLEEAFRSYLAGKYNYHKMNFQIMLANPRPIPEHTDVMEGLEKELSKAAYYKELLEELK